MALEGSLAVFQLPEILQMVALQNKTGILTVQGEQDIIAISFLHGGVVAADALNQTTEGGLGQILAAQGLVKPAQFSAAVAEHQTGGGRLVDALLQKGLLTRAQLLSALRAQTYNLLLQTLRWKDGSFKFYGGDEVSYEEGFQPISVEELLIRSLSDFQDPADLPDPKLAYEAMPSDRSFKMMDHTFAGVRDGSGVWLKAEEKALLEKLDGRRSAEDIGRELGLDEHKLRYSLYRLQEEGLARVSRRAPASPPAPQIAAPDGPSRPKKVPDLGVVPLAKAAVKPVTPPSPRPVTKPGTGTGIDLGTDAGSRPGLSDSGIRTGAARPAGKPKPQEEAEMVSTPPLALGRALAAGLVGLLLAAGLWQSGKLFFPASWQEAEREVFTRTQRLAQFQKIDRAAHTHFLLAGHYPDDLGRLIDLGLLDHEDLRDSAGRTLAYATDGVSYSLQPLENGQALVELSSAEGITGDFLLDPDFLKLPKAPQEAPLVLLD
jgi:hypothetical protein